MLATITKWQLTRESREEAAREGDVEGGRWDRVSHTRKSNSPQRTDHLWKAKARLTAKETQGLSNEAYVVSGSSIGQVGLCSEK